MDLWPSSLSSWTSGLLLGNELPAVLPVPGSTAASAVFLGAPPRNLLEPERRARRSPRRPPRARARVLPETTEALTREVLKLGDVGFMAICPYVVGEGGSIVLVLPPVAVA